MMLFDFAQRLPGISNGGRLLSKRYLLMKYTFTKVYCGVALGKRVFVAVRVGVGVRVGVVVRVGVGVGEKYCERQIGSESLCPLGLCVCPF